jgi:hypothetical protein
VYVHSVVMYTAELQCMHTVYSRVAVYLHSVQQSCSVCTQSGNGLQDSTVPTYSSVNGLLLP